MLDMENRADLAELAKLIAEGKATKEEITTGLVTAIEIMSDVAEMDKGHLTVEFLTMVYISLAEAELRCEEAEKTIKEQDILLAEQDCDIADLFEEVDNAKEQVEKLIEICAVVATGQDVTIKIEK